MRNRDTLIQVDAHYTVCCNYYRRSFKVHSSIVVRTHLVRVHLVHDANQMLYCSVVVAYLFQDTRVSAVNARLTFICVLAIRTSD